MELKEDQIIIPLVGNIHQSRIPNKYDNKIMLIDEPDNKYDPNAIAVYSNAKDGLIKLGYVIKDKTSQIKIIENKIDTISIIRSAEKIPKSNRYYYYLLINTK
jgi:hypothetical protein